jgi:hypothetical protein
MNDDILWNKPMDAIKMINMDHDKKLILNYLFRKVSIILSQTYSLDMKEIINEF